MNSTAYENSIVLQIDEKNRAITNDGKNTPIILGVKGDDCAERVYFESPKILSPEINLLDETEGVSVRVFVNYKNASNEPYIQECTDAAAVANTDTATFSWLVTNNATNTKGDVKFNVCVKKFDADGKLTNEWHTTTFVGKILDGIDVTAKTPEVITHDTVTLQALTLEVQNYAISVNSLTAKYEDVEAAIDASVEASVNSKMASYTTTEDADSKYLSKTDASSTYATQAMLDNLAPKTTVIKNNMNSKIPVWTNVGDCSYWGMRIDDKGVIQPGSKLKLYFGLYVDDYASERCFIVEIPVVRNTTQDENYGQASHYIRIGDAFEGVIFFRLHGPDNDKQLSASVITKLYDEQAIDENYDTTVTEFVLDKIEMITGAGI